MNKKTITILGTGSSDDVNRPIKETIFVEHAFSSGSIASSKLNRGDIVIFKNHEKNIDVVKRVIGLPGETVSSENGKVLINNSEIDDIWAKTVTDDFIQQTLGEDEVFVLGDQRRLSSSDSRTLGPVSTTECLKIKYRYWPYQRFKAYE